jgi:8-oxo-dGTP pyrophosphatase MutT (NUDIX family)
MADAAEDVDAAKGKSMRKKSKEVVIIIYYKDGKDFYILTGESGRYLSDHTSVGPESIKLAKKIEDYETLTLKKDDETALQTSFETFSRRAKELGNDIKRSVKFDKIRITDHPNGKYLLFSTHFIKQRGIRGLIKGGVEMEDTDEKCAILREVKEETGFEITNFDPRSFCQESDTIFSYVATKKDRDKIKKSVEYMDDISNGELFNIKFEKIDPLNLKKYNNYYNEVSLKSLKIFFDKRSAPMSVPMPAKKFKPKRSKRSKRSKKPKRSKKRSTTRRRACSPLCKRV